MLGLGWLLQETGAGGRPEMMLCPCLAWPVNGTEESSCQMPGTSKKPPVENVAAPGSIVQPRRSNGAFKAVSVEVTTYFLFPNETTTA
jgi:hypothetical protein